MKWSNYRLLKKLTNNKKTPKTAAIQTYWKEAFRCGKRINWKQKNPSKVVSKFDLECIEEGLNDCTHQISSRPTDFDTLLLRFKTCHLIKYIKIGIKIWKQKRVNTWDQQPYNNLEVKISYTIFRAILQGNGCLRWHLMVFWPNLVKFF